MSNDKTIPSLDFDNIDKSNETKELLNNKIKIVLHYCKKFTLDALLQYKIHLDKLAEVLFKKEVLLKEDIESILPPDLENSLSTEIILVNINKKRFVKKNNIE